MRNLLEQTVERTADRLATRYYGKYRGVVTDIDDPDTRCRIKAKVPAVLHEAESYWAMPVLPFAGDGHGFVMLPKVGAGVWIEFEAGDPDYPILAGCFWGAGEVPASPAVPSTCTVAPGATFTCRPPA